MIVYISGIVMITQVTLGSTTESFVLINKYREARNVMIVTSPMTKVAG
jgi:hypothetical protein